MYNTQTTFSYSYNNATFSLKPTNNDWASIDSENRKLNKKIYICN